MEILKSYLKKNIKVYILFVVFITIFFIMFYLYNLPLEALIYTGSFCFLVSLIASFLDFVNYKESYKNQIIDRWIKKNSNFGRY